MMRRWWGLVLVAVVLLTGLAVARVAGPGIVGTGRAEPVPGPPVAGECIAATDGASPTLLSFNDRQLGGRAPAAATGPCDGEIYGEVVVVIDAASRAGSTDSGVEEPLDPAIDECLTAGSAFVGVSGTAAGAEPTWSHRLQYYSAFAGPDDRQRAAGQDWLACVLRPANPDDDTTVPPYRGTLRDAIFTGVERDRTGVCAPDPTLEDFVPCSLPHLGENFGLANTREPSTRAEWEDSCRAWVSALTGLADPTADGQLELTLVVRDDVSGEYVGDPQIPAGAHLRCGLISADRDRMLTGSVRAIGDEPLPWD